MNRRSILSISAMTMVKKGITMRCAALLPLIFLCKRRPSTKTTLNLKTAKLLGFEVPPGILVAADEVIE